LNIDNLKQNSVFIDKTEIVLQNDHFVDRANISFFISNSLGSLTGISLDRMKFLVNLSRLSARSGVLKWKDLPQECLHFFSKELAIPCYTLENSFRVKESMDKILQNLGCIITL